MENPAGFSQSETFFGYDWAIVRELDRINRSSQKSTSLDERIHKLKAMAEYYLTDEEGETLDKYAGWREEWENSAKDASVPKEVRWKQLALLIRLFKMEGVFNENTIQFENLEEFYD